MPPPKAPGGKSLVHRRSIDFGGRKIGLSLEDAFWNAVKDIAAAQGTTIERLLAYINSERRQRQHSNFSSAIRLFVLDYYRPATPRGRNENQVQL